MQRENKKFAQVGKPLDNNMKKNVIGGAGTPIKKGDIKKMNS